ncbi:unnamed protein product [Prunus brigantina]
MFSKFEFDGKLNPTFVEGEFKLPLSSIRAYLKEPITPRFHILFILYQERRLLRFVLLRWKAPMHLARHLRLKVLCHLLSHLQWTPKIHPREGLQCLL